MGIYVNPGKESFEGAVNSEIYVDKTGLLEYTNRMMGTEQCYMCVSRPRRFGKSMAAGMLKAYYSKGTDADDLFSGLAISKLEDYRKHLNQHDVIHLDIAYLRSQMPGAMDTVTCMQQRVICELKKIYPGAIDDEERSLPFALERVNEVYGSRFIFIIDEWDALFRDDKKDEAAQYAYINLLRGLFKGEPSKQFTLLAYLTGILPIKRYNSESALNNFEEYTMLHPKRLAEYIGFTEKEVQGLCQQYDMEFDEMKSWYDGYFFRRVGHVYSPNSVVRAINNGECLNYWTETTAFSSLTDLIAMDFDGLKDSVLQLLAGEHIRVDTAGFENDMTSFQFRDDVLTVLIHLGYLAYDGSGYAYIPNEEVKTSFYQAIRGTKWTPVLEAYKASDALLQATICGDAEAVAAGIDRVHMKNTSLLNYNDENALSCVITLAYYNANNDYILQREQPAGKGYADIVFRPRRRSVNYPAMIVELKALPHPKGSTGEDSGRLQQPAESALAQIRERRYVEALEDYQGKVLLVGVNYDRETKEHTCVIEELEL